ncbi:Rz-like spanin [Pseudomonas phage PspYZU05]|uniref:Outer membrane lipoprotein n=1 Tax=Pseudomonas phage PspYZU05 TaxID=1983556 RepID=A0A2U7NF11_9CAUD|nr:Rz-like spanin [Pseudomonas phage PspYZU05]ASD52011.1 outer membrane lipoprotein [Pseudomonas phage PspYZU05]
MKLKLLIAISLLCTACSSTTIGHPDWPDSVQNQFTQEQAKNIKVIEFEGTPYVSVPYRDSLKFRAWLNDISRYIDDINDMLCHYRTELKEARCEKGDQ